MKKHYMSLAVGLVLSISGSAFASGTVCSNFQIYSSDLRYDFGTAPRPGTVTGKNVIALDGKVLLNHTSVAGMHVHGQPPYRLALTGPIKTLSTSGGPAAGSTVFEVEGVLYQVDPMDVREKQELARGQVLCKKTWAFPPAAPHGDSH